jgi:hypothetical protein
MSLVVIVVHCHLWLVLCGSAVVMRDCDEVIDPVVCAEKEDGLGTVPRYAAQLTTLPRLVLALVQCIHLRTDVGWQVFAPASARATRPDAHLLQMITQPGRSVQVIEKKDAVAVSPRSYQVNNSMMDSRMWCVVAALAAVDAKAQQIAI